MLKLAFAVALLVAAVLAWPAGEDRSDPPKRERAAGGPQRDRAGEREPKLPRPPCREEVPRCASASGRILYVEGVDPDGDGDLHVVVLDGSVTAAGLTAVDVSKELRPRRDPRPGDAASAMGPVQPGSFGQEQIHALEFHVRRG